MLLRKIQVFDSRVLVLGLAFKENCPDLRNSRAIDVIRELQRYHVHVDVHDPWVNPQDAKKEYGIELVEEPAQGHYDAVIITVAHGDYRETGAAGLRGYCNPDGILYDVKYLLPADAVDGRL
jgi:UDP-N-acetyl-D-galactosamine dehydrogenase